jgi:Ni2+-binding GTPase involved in maturation of urease and hydrogenase
MKLHLVGGFLGSGKTTAIIHAAKALMDRGQVVGVITNDQGKYLVDTAFFRLSDVPAVEVSGGCFCCNYDDLDNRLAQLIETTQPDVIFAESVGSCADVVATVVKPLLELGSGDVKPASFSVFADGRLLRRRLLDEEMPFSEDVVYVFDKQIEEAGLIVVNKTDLLSEMAVAQVKSLLGSQYPDKPALMQSSLSIAGVLPWLDRIEKGDLRLPDTALEIDYQRYGAGEAKLAWLDQEILLHVQPGQGRPLLRELITRMTRALAQRGAGIGHLKFIVQDQDGGTKISIPTLEEPGWEASIPAIQGEAVRLLVNARVEMDVDALRALLQETLDASGIRYDLGGGEAFHPKQPRPTHRF